MLYGRQGGHCENLQLSSAPERYARLGGNLVETVQFLPIGLGDSVTDGWMFKQRDYLPSY